MNLYLLTQTVNRGYDTFDSCVVCAPNEDQAKTIHPYGDRHYVEGAGWVRSDFPEFTSAMNRVRDTVWATPENITATLLGTADPSVKVGVVLASFRNG